MTYNAKVQYTAVTSGEQPFGIPFTYMNQDDIIVKVDGVVSAFTWLNASTVSVNVLGGQLVEITRDSSSDHLLVDFKDGTVLKERDLNTGFTQAFYLGQEAKDRAESSIELDPLGNFDAKDKRVINVANPVDEADAVNKRYLAYEYPAVKYVGDNMGAISIVAGDLSSTSLFEMDLGSITETPSVTTSGQEGSIRTVAAAITQVYAVAQNLANIAAVLDNLAAIIAAPANATTATNKATEALASAEVAVTKAAEALTSATNAAASASAAASSSASAALSKGTAITKATEAAASATAAASSATTATRRAGQASTSATNAANSATAAAASAAQAQSYAEGMAEGIPDGSVTAAKLASTLDLGSI